MAGGKLQVKDIEISVYTGNSIDDYICITDIAKYKDEKNPRFIIQNWMRNRNTVEFLGVWESLYNSGFNRVEFEAFRSQAGLNSFVLTPQNKYTYADEADVLNVALFGKTASQWRNENPDKKGNMRDYANMAQLVCLLNLESLNSVYISQGKGREERLKLLNDTAIRQMKLLLEDSRVTNLLDDKLTN